MRLTDKNTVTLDGNEIATAIDAYLTAHNVNVSGPRTITINVRGESMLVRGESMLLRGVSAQVYVDPSGKLVDNRECEDVTDDDLKKIVDDVKDQPHPDTWSVCGQREVLAIVRELQASRATHRRLKTTLDQLGHPTYIPLLKTDGGRSAHHNVVSVVRGALNGDESFRSFWQ